MILILAFHVLFFVILLQQAEQFGSTGAPLFPGASGMDEEEEDAASEASGEKEQEGVSTAEGTGEDSDTGEEVVRAQVKEERQSPPASDAPARVGEAGPSGSSVSQVEASKNKPPAAAEE